MGLGNVAIAAVTKLGSLALMTWLYQHRLVTSAQRVVDLGRALLRRGPLLLLVPPRQPRGALLWAAHVNHHSSEHYNLSTALRQSWTTPFTGAAVLAAAAAAGLRAADDPDPAGDQPALPVLDPHRGHRPLPAPLEWVFNTPSHHRVHHGATRRTSTATTAAS
jgi:alkylglycerol monooxygenase